MKFCGECGNKLVGGKCAGCAQKSVNGLSTESLEKSLALLEDMAKGVRPGLAKKEADDKRTPEKANDDAVDQLERHAKETEVEGDSDENPKTKKGVEKDKFVKGFDKKAPFEQEMEEEEEDEDPREREREEEEFPMKSAGKKKAKKSLSDSLLEDKRVRDAVDVSDFLKSITDHLVDSTDSLTASVNKSLQFAGYQKGFNQVLAKSLIGLVEIVKSQNAEIVKLGSQPVGIRKSELNAAPIEKSFNIGEPKEGETINKSQAAAKLLDLRQNGDFSITSHDISMVESTGNIRPELKAKLGIN